VLSFALQPCAQQAENVAVVLNLKTAALGLQLLVTCLAVAAQNPAPYARGASTSSSKTPSPESRVDINAATLEELMKVPGITRVWADRIVRFRPYRTKADLEEQGIIPADVYDRVKDSIIAHHIKQ